MGGGVGEGGSTRCCREHSSNLGWIGYGGGGWWGGGRPRKSGMEGFKGGVWAVREFSKFGSVYKFQKFRFLGIRKQMFENFWEGL